MGRHAVGLVNDGDIPGDLAELLGQVFAAGELVHAGDQERVLGEDVATLGVIDHLAAEDFEAQVELLTEFLAPLLHEPTRGDDDRSLAVRAQDQLLQIEPGHDRLARAGVVGQQEPQRDARQQLLVDRANLVRQRVNVRAVDRDHRVIQRRVLDPQRLGCEPELVRIGIVGGSGVKVTRDLEPCRVGIRDRTSAAATGVVTVEDLEQLGVDGIDGNQGDRLPRHQATEALARAQRRETHGCLGRLTHGHLLPVSGQSIRIRSGSDIPAGPEPFYSVGLRVVACSSTTSAHPLVDLAGLELPEASDLVSWHVLLSDPGVDGVFGDPEVGGDVVRRQPRLRHSSPPGWDRPGMNGLIRSYSGQLRSTRKNSAECGVDMPVAGRSPRTAPHAARRTTLYGIADVHPKEVCDGEGAGSRASGV